MTDPINAARNARDSLRQGLQALQSPGVPPGLMAVAEPVAAAMGELFKIEQSQGAALPQSAPAALDAVRRALSMLQTQPAQHPAVAQAVEAVAGSLSVVHGIARAAEGATAGAGPGVQPQPQPAAVSPAAGGAVSPVAGTVVLPGNQPQSPYVPSPAPQGAQAPQQPAPAQSPYVPNPAAQPTPGAAPPHPGAAGPQPGGWPGQAQPAQPGGWPPQPQPAAAAAPQPGGWPQQAQPAAAPQPGGWPPQPQPAAAAAPQPGGWPPQPQPQPVPAAAPPMDPAAAGPALRVEAELGAHSATNFYKGLSGNDVIDSGGIFVATYQVPKLGQNLILKVSMPGGYEFEAMGVVRWTREAGDGDADLQPGFGAKLTQISPEGRQLVYRYVRNREPLFHDDL